MKRTSKKGFNIQYNLEHTVITFNNEREAKLITIHKELRKCQLEDNNFAFRLRGNFITLYSTNMEYVNMVIDLLEETSFSPQTHCVFCDERTNEEIYVNGKYFTAHRACFKK